MFESLREVLADLFNLVLAVMQLETSLVERQSQILNLETRILEAGLRVRPAD